MLTRLNLTRRGCCLVHSVLIKYRPVHVTTPLAVKDHTSSSSKKNPVTTSARSSLSASDISELITKRFHLNEQRGIVKALVIGCSIIAVSTFIFLYVFRKPIKNQTVAQVAEVAKSSLEQDSVKQQVNALSQELVQNLLTDSNVLSKALIFLERVMDNPSTKQTFISLLQTLMNDRDMQQYVSEFTSKIVYNVMNDPETAVQLGQLLRRAILQQDNQDALVLLLKDFVNDERTKQLINNVALDTSNRVLNDESVKQAATTFVKDILSDAGIQDQSGDFAWNAIKNALKPKWFTSHAKSMTSTLSQTEQSNKTTGESDFQNSIIPPPLVRST